MSTTTLTKNLYNSLNESLCTIHLFDPILRYKQTEISTVERVQWRKKLRIVKIKENQFPCLSELKLRSTYSSHHQLKSYVVLVVLPNHFVTKSSRPHPDLVNGKIVQRSTTRTLSGVKLLVTGPLRPSVSSALHTRRFGDDKGRGEGVPTVSRYDTIVQVNNEGLTRKSYLVS